jgi:hypothetical protein
MKRSLSLLVLTAFGCGGSSEGPLDNIKALAILQRAPRLGGIGDVFQYTSYEPGGRIMKLQPPTADGTLTVLCCEQFGVEFATIDIQAYDVSFDGKAIVFSGKLTGAEPYGLFLLALDDNLEPMGPPSQLATDMMRDYVYPVFAPLDRIVFVTNSVVEAGAPQHRDEYERGTTTQMGSIGIDGSGEVLGARNLSHRVAPTMLESGQVMLTQWDHLGDVNAGHLMMMNPDFTNMREVFGKEGTGLTNSYLKAVEIPRDDPTDPTAPTRLITIATDRDRTLQSGKLLQVTMGRVEDGVFRQSESRSSFVDLTPLVPGDDSPSFQGVGRYYDAYPIPGSNKKYGERPFLVVSWADGPVQQETLAAADAYADFGIYLFNSATGTREPVFNDPERWDVFPRPLEPRTPPDAIEPSGTNAFSAESLLVSSLNVYDSSTNADDLPAGSVYGVRVIEGFSVEEGIPDDFGLTEHEGAAVLGVAPVYSDGSWAALVPANVPLHLQPFDVFGMALVNEPVWFSGRPGEARVCGGCHEDRAKTLVVGPGVSQALSAGPIDLDRPRAERRSVSYDSIDAIVGVPWDSAVQQVFDAHCVSCHNGTPGAANPSYRITDPITGEFQDIVFDLRPGTASYGLGEAIMSGYSISHLSLLGPMMMELEDAGLIIEGEIKIYVEPGAARESVLLQKLNPPQLFPTYDASVRAFDTVPHLEQLGLTDLSPEEYYVLILMADNGGQFYSRENAPGGSGY